MTKGTRNSLFIIFLLAILACGTIGYYLYNKGPVDVADGNAVKVNATDLYEIFIKDSLTAQKSYIGKILEVSGEVNEISVNQQKNIILLKTNSDDAFVNCTMEGPIKNIQAFDKINIKGICSGIGEGDTDLGIKGDVYLTRCYLTK